MATIEQRIAALEQKSGGKLLKVFRIICKGETPTIEEQAQIDEAQERGDWVICRLIVSHPKITGVPESGSDLHQAFWCY